MTRPLRPLLPMYTPYELERIRIRNQQALFDLLIHKTITKAILPQEEPPASSYPTNMDRSRTFV